MRTMMEQPPASAVRAIVSDRKGQHKTFRVFCKHGLAHFFATFFPAAFSKNYGATSLDDCNVCAPGTCSNQGSCVIDAVDKVG